MNQFIIGLSGHIDHGKTSLVEAITGQNTDNLKEEIDRGMTINIGFAFLNEKITLIDVPGHEKFIKNMVAGVNAIDYAILVIAADDGIMPQTIEHFEILNLLNIEDGCIVINKIDKVDKEWLELVELDIKKLVKNTFLDNKKIHRVSTLTNHGIPEFKNFLLTYNFYHNRKDRGVFRLFVDRVFQSKGFGNIVTGTITSGKVKVGDKMKILPQNKEVKIRGLQTHNSTIDYLSIGNRAAINIQLNEKISVKRGNQISDIECFNVYEQAIVSIKILSKVNKKINNNDRVRIYLGTQEVMARVQIFNAKFIDASKSSFCILKFEKPICISINDNFIIRQYSPLVTIGGGVVIDFYIHSKWKDNKKYIDLFNNNNNNSSSIIYIRGLNPFSYNSFKQYLDISDNIVNDIINNNDDIILVEKKWLLTNKQIEDNINIILSFFKKFHNQNPNRKGMLKEEILNFININDQFLDSLLLILLNDNKIKCNDNLWSNIDFSIRLNDNEIKLCHKIHEMIHDLNFSTLTIDQIVIKLEENQKMIKKIISIEVANKNLILINGSLLFTSKNIDMLINNVKKYFDSNENLDVKSFKNLINSSRKYAVPLLEYLDKINITYRVGNERKLK